MIGGQGNRQGPDVQGVARGQDSEDVAKIGRLWEAYKSTIEEGDMEGWLSLWIPEGKQMPPGAPHRIGMEELREGNRPLMVLFDAKMNIHPAEIRILGDHAYSHGVYDYALKPKEGGETVSAEGKFLTILVKQEDGSWKIAIDCFNDNAPPAG
jgi:uncharacterized protein (TIGR02246 family)